MSQRPLAVTRRQALRWTATAGAVLATTRTLPAFARAAPRPAFRPTLLAQVDYAQVDLAPGPLQRQFEENHQLLLSLDEDSLLRPFRLRGSLPAPGAELGGWYSTHGFAPACPYGQWLSALARFYAVTQDEPTRAKIDRMVRGYAATVDPTGKFYPGYMFPAYIYDKLVCGLTDAHLFAGQPTALDVLALATDAALPHLPARALPHKDPPIPGGVDDESYTLPENLFLAWQRTGTQRYYDLAQRFLFHEYFDPLARNENALPGRHAYSHVNALSSAAATYLATGDRKYLKAATNGFAFVQDQSFATGGWGPHEHFITPGTGQLGDSLNSMHASFETPCGAYAHFKIARYLLRITGDSSYGDSMERVLYNTVLGARPIQPDGTSFYYSDYTFTGLKRYHNSYWPCCSGTLPQIAADYRISAYFQHPHGIYVNLYVPSTLRWQNRGAQFSLRQLTDYPYDSHIRFDVTAGSPATFSVFLRIPAWASAAALTVNGRHDSMPLLPGTFAEVRRHWKTGDRIELNLPFVNSLEPVDPQHPDTVALVTGPLVLMALRDSAPDLAPQPASAATPVPAPATQPALTRAALLAAQQASPLSHQWAAASPAGPVTLKPFLDIDDEPYTTYLKVDPA